MPMDKICSPVSCAPLQGTLKEMLQESQEPCCTERSGGMCLHVDRLSIVTHVKEILNLRVFALLQSHCTTKLLKWQTL